MKAQRFFTFLSIMTLLLVACTSLGTPAESENPPLKIGWSFWPGFYPILIADEQGFFAEHNVDVEPVFYEIYTDAFADVQADAIDGNVMTLLDALLLDGRQPDSVRAVLVIDSSNGGDAVVATSDINSPADLKGQTIGMTLGSFGEALVRTMLKENGLTVGDVTLIDMNPESVPDALGNTIQAGQTWEPFVSESVAQGNHILFSSAEAPGLISDVLIFRTEIVETRPDDVRAVTAAWLDAMAWWQENPDEGSAIIAGVTGLPQEEISFEGIIFPDLEANLQAFQSSTDTTSLYTSGQLNIDILIGTGSLTTVPDIDRLLDPSFLQQ